MGFFNKKIPLNKTWAFFEIEAIVNTINILHTITKKEFSAKMHLANLMDYEEDTYKGRHAEISYFISFKMGHKFELKFFKVYEKSRQGIEVELLAIKKEERLNIGDEIFVNTEDSHKEYSENLKRKITYLDMVRQAAKKKFSEIVKIIGGK